MYQVVKYLIPEIRERLLQPASISPLPISIANKKNGTSICPLGNKGPAIYNGKKAPTPPFEGVHPAAAHHSQAKLNSPSTCNVTPPRSLHLPKPCTTLHFLELPAPIPPFFPSPLTMFAPRYHRSRALFLFCPTVTFLRP